MDEEKKEDKPKKDKPEKKKKSVGELKKELQCSKCGSRYVYSLKDGILVCRKCSFREKV
jgi:ribosomal protein L37AE/L43A